jgi:hypothetical protein
MRSNPSKKPVVPEFCTKHSAAISKKFSRAILAVAFGIFISGCAAKLATKEERPAPASEVSAATLSAPMLWLREPASRWERDFSNSPRDSLMSRSPENLDEGGIGVKTRVYDLFDRWKLSDSIRAGRGTQYAEISGECQGKIELDFALTPEQWQQPAMRRKYYLSIDALIARIGNQLLADFGDTLQGQEKKLFLHALKTLAWQESRWQHYLRHQDWFFVIVSGGSYNKLDDWGITQIARSSFDPKKLLNNNFFESKGYCSISSSLYYGFMEYYFCYLEAREHPGNGPSLFNKIVGAYNRYSSGYSACYYELAANDAAYRDYQIRAMGGFKDNFVLKPWEAVMQETVNE